MAIVKRKVDPSDKLDFGFNWEGPQSVGGPFLLDGESITASTWTLYDADWNVVTDVTVSSTTNTGTVTTAFFGPAADDVAVRGETRFLTNHIVTNQGREKDWSYQFTMEEQ